MLATKFAAALFPTAACRTAGLDGSVTAIIAASFLVASLPMAALRATASRVIAMVVDAALGIADVFWRLAAGGGVPPASHLVLEAVVGPLASRDATVIDTAAIAVAVASTGTEDTRSLGTIVFETCSQPIIGTVIALGVVGPTVLCHT